MRVLLVLVFLAGVCGVVIEPASAQAPAPSHEPARAQPVPGVLPGLAAVVPGILLRGSGTYLAKDKRTAKRLAIAGGAGLAAFFLSGAVLAASGSSRRLVGPFAPLLFAGTAAIFTTWLADIYGATTGGREATAAAWVAPVEWELGYRYVHDPQFAYGSFGYARADLRAGAWRATPSAFVALDDDNQRLSLELAYRLRGRQANARGSDGSYLDLSSALLHHRYGTERFAVWTPALTLEGRLDLAHVGESLRGAFVDGQLGAGFELYRFYGIAARARENGVGLLLARFAFGVYFGQGGARSGEASIYYDHRHDDFAAGMGVQGIGSGVLGHVGAGAHYYFDERWGAGLTLEVGSAVVTGASLRYRAKASS